MLFDDLSFELQAGQARWVQGENGAGTTSLLRLLCGLSQPDEGEVRWRGVPLARQRESFHAELLHIGHASGVKDDLSAWENVVFSAALAGATCRRDEAHAALEQLGLAPAVFDLPARLLSQGQRKRVALARLGLSTRHPLWVLDEPLSALDASTLERLQNLLGRHLSRGGLLVCTTHQALDLPGHTVQTLNLSALESSCSAH